MMIDFDGLIWWAGLAFLGGFLFIQRRRGRGGPQLFFAALMGVYLMLVARGTLFPIPILPPEDPARQVPFLYRVNLRPLYFGPFTHSARALFWLAAPNILLTVPFGFLLPFLARLRARQFLWLPLVAGVSIEAAQLLISLLIGYLYRVLDVNDMIFNTAGVVGGYLAFRVFAGLYKAALNALHWRPGGLAGYVYAVAERAGRW